MQWRARAIGEKSAAAEARLEKAGPFEGMDVRRAMAVVLEVLKEVLGDDFSTDRLEMVCVDVGRECGDDIDGRIGEGGRGRGRRGRGATGAVRIRTKQRESAFGSGFPGAGEESSTSGEPPLLPEGVDDGGVCSNDGVNGGAGLDEGAGVGSVGELDRPSTSERSPPFLPRSGYFRRVPKSEMEELLGDGGLR